MPPKALKVVWTKQAQTALKSILDYRYREIPSARKTLRA